MCSHKCHSWTVLIHVSIWYVWEDFVFCLRNHKSKLFDNVHTHILHCHAPFICVCSGSMILLLCKDTVCRPIAGLDVGILCDISVFQFLGQYKGILNTSLFQECRIVEGANSETWLAMSGVVVLLLLTLLLFGSASIYGSTADQKKTKTQDLEKTLFPNDAVCSKTTMIIYFPYKSCSIS